MARFTVTLSCEDRPGIVNGLTAALLDIEGNITDSAQFGDPGTGRFFLRTSLQTPMDDQGAVAKTIESGLHDFAPELTVHAEGAPLRVLVMVSRLDHCLLELLYRWDRGELPIEVVSVVSNHEICRPLAEQYGVPFEHVPLTPSTKKAAEARLIEIVEDHQVELVVLARYMQVLSEDACRRLGNNVINIHHSFLPGFKGARPYHQAHDRGVKLIGATAHFVTADLDEGPIIEQDTVRVSHTDSVGRLVALGRDVERRVLADAVRAFAEHRVFLNGHKTVVFL